MSFEIVEVGGVKTVSTKAACNHVYVVDVSGSMYGSLAQIRQHLKNIISVVAQPDDTFSVIYFSGKGQCGVVFENVLVSDVSTVTMMHDAIDRYLKTIGLTGFVDPIRKALTLNLDKSKVNNFIMLTDGYDNQSRRDDILNEATALQEMYQSITFIEYGFYADRELLSKMADAVNGVHIFAEGVVNYEAVIEDAVRGVARVQNVAVNVNKRAKHAVYVYNGQIRITPAEDGVVHVPEDVERVHSIVPSDVVAKQLSEEHLFLILFYAAKTSNSELVWKCLTALGDVALVEQYQNAFTKQELSKFEESVQNAVFNVDARYVDGKDLAAVPNKNAPTVIDLLKTLAECEDANVVTDSPFWSYNRIGRASEAQAELPRFVQSPLSRVSLKGLVFNSERPNVSIQTTLGGTVLLPENEFKLDKVPSFITRNYTVIKDGIRNMNKLPVTFKATDADQLRQFKHEVIEEGGGLCYWVFDLSKTPVINRGMVETVDQATFVARAERIESLKARLKVVKALLDEKGGTTAKIAGLVNAHGEEAAKWLSSIGVRDYGYSAVGTTSAEATDEYESIQVLYKIKGLSSLPAIKAVREKVDGGKKLNFADNLIKAALDVCGAMDVKALEGAKDIFTKEKRILEAAFANDVYTLVLGRQWFGDEDDITVDVTVSGQSAPMTISKVRKSVKI